MKNSPCSAPNYEDIYMVVVTNCNEDDILPDGDGDCYTDDADNDDDNNNDDIRSDVDCDDDDDDDDDDDNDDYYERW